MLEACFALNSRVSGSRPTEGVAVGCGACGDGSTSGRLINEDRHLEKQNHPFPSHSGRFVLKDICTTCLCAVFYRAWDFKNTCPYCCVPEDMRV